MKRTRRILSTLLFCLAVAACGGDAPPEDTRESGAVPAFAWVSKNVARGGEPRGEAAFRQLAEAGIRTAISVDGATPDVETAKRHGIRYVHIPLEYSGVPGAAAVHIAKTVRELPGPFFIHCHHGHHRGPTAAVLAEMVLGGMDAKAATAEMKRAGTAEKYRGLYESVRTFTAPAPEVTRTSKFDFPAVAAVPPLTEAMALIDRQVDRVKLIREAVWMTPENHPDLVPAREVLQLMRSFIEISRQEEVKKRPEAFRDLLRESADATQLLESALREQPVNVRTANSAWTKLRGLCTSCHRDYR